MCDPMHGNTISTPNGLKTRPFDKIMSEVEQAFALHKSCGSTLGGMHLELTGEDVTECTGGARNLSHQDLERAYKSQGDRSEESRVGKECVSTGRYGWVAKNKQKETNTDRVIVP